jgi:hypothetical protein
MIYGTYPAALECRARTLLSEFVEIALRKGCRFVTRGGAASGSEAKWNVPKSGVMPVDNIIIGCVKATCKDQAIIRSSLRTYVNRDRTEPVNIGQETLYCPDLRYEMYSCFLEDVDLFVFLGGEDGVMRLGLLCHFLHRPFVTLTAFDGGAKELGDSFYRLRKKDHYQNLRRDDCLRLEGDTLTGEELYQIARRNLRSPLAFALYETLTGRMHIGEFSGVAGQALDHAAGFLGKIVLAATAITPLYFIFRSEVKDLIRNVVELLSKLRG